MPSLQDAITALSRTQRLLVACDYDGTLAPIVDDPAQAWPHAAAAAALVDLAALPDTAVALISGRARGDLVTLSGLGPPVTLVGSHGAEFEAGFLDSHADGAGELLARLDGALEPMVTAVPGAQLERKPVSIAVHVRRAVDQAAGARLLEAVRSGPATWPGVQTTEGKAVVELAVIHTDKGAAVDLLRETHRASAVLFVGDDVTDEKAFAVLRTGDVSVKVGPGDTLAQYRVDTVPDVADLLETVLRHRVVEP